MTGVRIKISKKPQQKSPKHVILCILSHDWHRKIQIFTTVKKYILLLSVFLVFICTGEVRAQLNSFKPTLIRKAVYSDLSPPLIKMKMIPPQKKKEVDEEIPNRMDIKGLKQRQQLNLPFQPDGSLQLQYDTLPSQSAPILDFDGVGNISGYYPPDTQGDVGLNYYIQNVNINFAIYNKSGTLLYGPATLSTIWAGIPAPWNGTNSGDPVVLYDQAADRWIISQMSTPNTTQYAELVAISQTSDPTGSWYRYVFQFGSKMPDYPKLAVWPDGYYMSQNQFISGSSWGGVGTCAFERAKMLTGDPTAQMVYFDLGAASDPWAMLPSDWDGPTPPPANSPNWFVYYDDWSYASQYLFIYKFHVDWVTPANSTFIKADSLVTASFISPVCGAPRNQCIPQPGTTTKLESLSDRLMFRLQYRNFGDHEAMVTNHTVDADGTGHAGIRWYEMRINTDHWSIYQQGTFSPDASHRWVGSIALNGKGDIALGYSVSNSTTLYPSIKYTGRLAGDPLGQMTMGEQLIKNGTGCQTGPRWGDYSMMSVDPAGDSTFWFTTEYIQNTGGGPWKTKISSFNIHAGTDGLWTGATSTNWNTVTNWNNNLIPTSFSTITIPASAPNWPVYSGDFTVGTTCQNIVLNGNDQLTVNGKLTINPGYTVSVTSTGNIKVSGDWVDNGKFNCGTGTVEFTGTGTSTMTGGLNPIGNLLNLQLSTFTAGMTALSGATTITSGDDVATNVNIGFTFNYLGTNYTQVRFCSNGWLSFDLSGLQGNVNSYLFTSTVPNTTVAPWFDDLNADGSSTLSYKTEGSAPNRIFTAEWKNVLTYNVTATARINFQVRLYETTNVIEFQYGSLVAGTHSGSESASIGLEDATGGTGHYIESTTGSTQSGITNLVSTTGWPAVNYRFTPPNVKETFYNLKNSKTSGTLIIQPDIIVNGNLNLGP